MRTRTVVVALAALILCTASRALAQWAPGLWSYRRNSQAPSRRGPVQHPANRTQRGPVQTRKAGAKNPVVRKSLTPPVNRRQDWDWNGASVGYRAYDMESSDSARRYHGTPGYKE